MSNYWQIAAGSSGREYSDEFIRYGLAFVGGDTQIETMNYAQHFPKCQVIFVSNGYCYKAYRRTKDGFSSEPSAYLNIRDSRDAYPLNPKIPGALEVLRLLLKGT